MPTAEVVLSPEDIVDELLIRFMYLYRGREDAWGAIHGECVRTPLTEELWWGHLFGDGSVGVYPLVSTADGPRVAWGATDVDDGYEKSLPLAINLHNTLKAMGITSWVEKTKGKGFHVLVFVEGWVEAKAMRECLLVAHQVAGVKPTEVNPKQTTFDGKSHGNYLHAAYAKKWVSDGRRVVLDIDGGAELTLEEFVNRAHGSLNHPDAISKWAARYVPPAKPKPKYTAPAGYAGGSTMDELVRRMPGLAHTIFQKGVLEGRDRSGTLQRLAYLLAECGQFSASDATRLLYDADQRWGKYHERGDTHRLDDMIGRAF